MAENAGMFYVFHGDQEFLLGEETGRLKGRVAEDGMGDLNIVTLDGRSATVDDVLNACNTMPFMTERRLVIVEGLLRRLSGRSGRGRSGRKKSASTAEEGDEMERLVSSLSLLPPHARLLFVETESLRASNPLIKAAESLPNGYVRMFSAPRAREMPRWVSERARAKGATIDGAAASLLARLVGDDLRSLDGELEKLAAYAGYEQTISTGDIRELVSAAQETNIFALVDALGLRQRQAALTQLRALLSEGANELYVLSMISRQIRLLITVKELSEVDGKDGREIRKEAGISHQFIVDKLLAQAKGFSLAELESVVDGLIEIDHAIKTGRVEGGLALEMLVLEVCVQAPEGGGYQGRSSSRTR